MKVLQRLTVENLRKNQRRTIVTVIGVLLSTALILAVVGMVTSFQKMMVNYTIAEYGDFHEMYQEVPVAAIEQITHNHHVASQYYSQAVTAEGIGEEDYQTYQVYQHLPYHASSYEKFQVLPSGAEGKYNVYVRYDQPKQYEEIRQSILGALEAELGENINYRTNSDLLRYESQVMNDSALAMLYSMAAIVIAIIVVTSIFVIRNSFSISATERARQFGMLASVGATPRQIRHSVFFEGLVIGIIGIPLGILLGIAAVAVLVVVVNVLLEGMMETVVEFAMPFWIFPVTITLSMITIFFSSLMPAIRAARMSPIEAIRGNQDIKIKAKKLRSPKIIKNVFGIGGVIADKNLKRSRKKYRTTVISIVLSVATFIGLYSFISYGQDLIGMEFTDSEVDYAISGASAEFYQEIQEKFDLKDSAYYLQSTTHDVFVMQQAAFEKFASSLGIHEKDYSHVAIMNPYYIYQENGKTEVKKEDVNSGQKATFRREPVGAMPDKCIETEELEGVDGTHSTVDMNCYYAAVGQPKDIEITITKITDQYPIGYDTRKYWTFVLVPENYYLRSELNVVTDLKDKENHLGGQYIETNFYAENVENGKEISEYIDQRLKSGKIGDDYIYYQDVREDMSQMRRMYLLISIFLYGFVIVVTLIGVTNIFNTITTNIALRAREFAILKSIGMTSHEFNRMVRLESLMYSLKALLIGIPLGLLLSYGFYQSFANTVDFGWSIPWIAILISAAAVGILISIIMHYSVRQVEKQNIIETIRQENI